MYKILGADGKEYGPVSLDQLKEWIAQGRANAQTKVQVSGSTEWKPAGQIPELNVLFAPPATPAMPAGMPPPLSVGAAETGQSKGLAIASFILGLFGMLCLGLFAGIPAIICGHVALGRSRRAPAEYGGSGFAVAGLILGYLSIVLSIVVGIFFFTVVSRGNMGGPQFGPRPQFGPGPMRFPNQGMRINNSTPSGRCANNLRQIGLAFKIWSIDNGDQFPFNVSTNRGGTVELCAPGPDGYDANEAVHFQVISNDLGSTQILICPEDHNKQAAADFTSLTAANISYRLRTGPNVTDAKPMEVLATCPIHGHILRCDGSVQQK